MPRKKIVAPETPDQARRRLIKELLDLDAPMLTVIIEFIGIIVERRGEVIDAGTDGATDRELIPSKPRAPRVKKPVAAAPAVAAAPPAAPQVVRPRRPVAAVPATEVAQVGEDS